MLTSSSVPPTTGGAKAKVYVPLATLWRTRVEARRAEETTARGSLARVAAKAAREAADHAWDVAYRALSEDERALLAPAEGA